MRTGVNFETGEILKGWKHCVQSIHFIIRTRIGSLKWRRMFGAHIKNLIDRNASAREILIFYSAIADALHEHEPGFKLSTIEIIDASEQSGRAGQFTFLLTGTFYPNGHLGDFTAPENVTTQISPRFVNQNGVGSIEVAA